MSLKNELQLFLAGQERPLPEIYKRFPKHKPTTIRGRINEAIDQYFKRIDTGVYTAILGKYQVVYADPAWQYNDKGCRGAAEKHYPTMPLQHLKALPVADLCQRDAVLFLWATPPLLLHALEVMKAWGFNYKTIAFVWIKLNKNHTVFKGLGHYTRANAELCLLGVRRKGVKVVDHTISQVLQSVREVHSKKPSAVYSKIESLHGSVERLELFARTTRDNWDFWGNMAETESQARLEEENGE